MPEKTKLEDYTNMNNTGFAFIDLNEDLKENIKESFNSEYFVVKYTNNKEDLIIDISNIPKELKKFYEKIEEIYESKKPLFVKIKMNVIGQTDKLHKFYDTIIKNCSIYKNSKNSYELIINMGCDYSSSDNSYIGGTFNVIHVIIEYYEDNDTYLFSFTISHKG